MKFSKSEFAEHWLGVDQVCDGAEASFASGMALPAVCVILAWSAAFLVPYTRGVRENHCKDLRPETEEAMSASRSPGIDASDSLFTWF
jgi:hypothetical protein